MKNLQRHLMFGGRSARILGDVAKRGGVLLALLLGLLGNAWAAEKVTYYYTDDQGTILARTDANGVILTTVDYRPYGAQVLGSPEQGPGYTGHVNDADTGLVYMQQRYYDPDIGRFLSADPIPTNSHTGGSFNRYAYANNNPYTFIDPDGRDAVAAFGGVLTETWNAINGRGFNGAGVLGALRDGYDGRGDGFGSAVYRDATSFVPIGKPLQLVGGAVKAVKAGVQANRAAGKAAEVLAAKELVAEGNVLLGSQVGARTSDGLRVIDHLIETPAGKLVAVEVKAGNGVRNTAQRTRDGLMSTEGATLTGKNARRELRKQSFVIETIERRYPNQ
jgi:RHS repeat-associated protein